jgi:hypothetical protein
MNPELEQRIETLKQRIELLYDARATEQENTKEANDAEELAIIKERDEIQQALIESGEAYIPAQEIQTININDLQENSILLIKINAEHGMRQRMAATQQIARALQPLNDLVKSKKIVTIVMAENESIEVLDEEQMGKFGWFKKESSLIINPFTNKPAK